MRILFITSTRLGDCVLSTGLLDYLSKTYPQSMITVAGGFLGINLLKNFPNVEAVLPMKKRRFNAHWFELWRQVAPTKWDMIVDLRGSIISHLLRAEKKHVWHRYYARADKMTGEKPHKVIQLSRFLGLDNPADPILYFSKDQMQRSTERLGKDKDKDRVILSIAPSANWIGKTWPAERFIVLLNQLRTKHPYFKNCHVAVFAAPGEEKAGNQILQSIEDDKRLDFIGKTRPSEAAALIAQTNFFIGNDSGLMHCAAASGVLTLGLFGPTDHRIYRPWGEKTAVAHTQKSFEELHALSIKNHDICLMDSLSVEAVYESADQLYQSFK